jgi:CSLREA domain-containing protein
VNSTEDAPLGATVKCAAGGACTLRAAIQAADAAGYCSQAHMSDDVRKLTGTTAVRFLEHAGLTAA